MKKSKLVLIFSTIVVTTMFLVGLGFVFEKTDEEKINWLADVFDVSKDDRIAFVQYKSGKPEVYIKDEDEIKPVLSLAAETEVLDLIFTPNGEELVLSTTKRHKDDLFSDVILLDLHKLEWESLFKMESLVTEIQFDPKNEEKLYYLMARTYENYSPIAQEYPHGFDVFHINLENKEHYQHTNLNQYSMTSLQVSDVKEAIYVQMDDDFNAETADEIFEVKQRIFELALDSKQGFTVFSDPERQTGIFDFALIPGGEALIFQSISNAGSDGIFEYDLYYYNWKTKEEERLTNLSSFADKPIISESEGKIYFMVDENFGKNAPPNRALYSIDMDGANLTEVNIQIDD